MPRPTSGLLLLVSVVGLLGVVPPVTPALAEGVRLVVSPQGPYSSIETALAEAQSGDVIEVQGGVYPAPLVIEKTVSLIGVGQPVIDANGEGSLVHILAPDVTLQGFVLRNSGRILEHEDTAILTQAPHTTIADNVLENVLFGIYFSNAPSGLARNNVIRGLNLDVAARGDGILVWYSPDVVLEGNEVMNTRDTVIWYADNIVIAGNYFHGNRYGLHFMYSSNALIESNRLEDNSVGSYLMYSDGLTMRQNTFAHNRGPSGYGMGLKDMDRVTVADNVFIANRAGLYVDNSPSSYEGNNQFTGNLFAYNDIGVTMLPAVQRNLFQRNTFLENVEQVSVHGRGTLQGNTWHQDGVGNFWSDYQGFDQAGDGIGDLPYRSEKLFESLVDGYPALRLFAFSPATQAIDFAAAAFPSLRPEPKLIDEAPLSRFTLPAQLVSGDAGVSLPMLGVGALLVILAGSLGLYARRSFHIGVEVVERASESVRLAAAHQDAVEGRGSAMIVAEDLTKRYGDLLALNQVSFAIAPGEAVALWGANGAGKTTALQCLLGVLSFEGRLTVNGLDVHRQGKAVRASIGYVPQEAAFHDLTVRDALKFYARLKKVSAGRVAEVLNWVQLAAHANKPVHALSGGMKQRLSLAVALLSDPPVLVLDEPTANLDAQAREDFVHMIQRLNRAGKTIIFSSHRVEEVVALAGRVLVLDAGSLVRECTPVELAQQVGVQQWLRIQIPSNQHERAISLLREQDVACAPNGNAIYVHTNGAGKVAPLRALLTADIPVEDFEFADHRVFSSEEAAQ